MLHPSDVPAPPTPLTGELSLPDSSGTRAPAPERGPMGEDALYRLLVASVRDYAIFALTPEGRVATWNPGAERLKGYTAAEIVGRPLSVFYPPETHDADGVAPRALSLLQQAATTGRADDEGWRVRKDGTRFWGSVVITPVRDDAGTLVGFAKVTRDLTAQRDAEERARELAVEQAARAAAERAEAAARVLAAQFQEQALELEAQTEAAQSLAEELEQTNEQLQQAAVEAEEARDVAEGAQRVAEEAQARYRRLFEASPQPSWTVDLETLALLDVNEAAVRRYGYTREEFRALTLRGIRDPASLPQLGAMVAQLAATGEFHGVVTHRTKQGERLDVEMTARRIEQDGRPAILVVLADVTERVRAEARQRLLVEASAMLAESLDYDATISRIVRLAVPGLADWAAYNVVDGEYVRTVAIHHPDPAMERLAREIDARYPQRADAGAAVAKVLATGQPELIPELPDEVIRQVAYDETHYEQLRSIGLRSLINVPLVARGRVLGALGFGTGASGRTFTQEDLAFAEELGRRAGLALDNALYVRAEHEARAQAEVGVERLGRLQRLGAAMSTAVDADALSRIVVREARATMQADAAYVVRRTADPDTLEFLHGDGFPAGIGGHALFPLAAPVPGAEVVRTAQPLWLATRAERNARFGHMQDSPIARAFHSSATLPLLAQGRAEGALGVYFAAERAFTAEERAFLGALTEQVALAFARVSLFEAEQAARRRAERLQALTAALARAATPDAVIEAAIEEGGRAVGSMTGALALLDDAGETFTLVPGPGMPADVALAWRRFPNAGASSAAEAVRTLEPSYSRTRAEFAARSPALAALADRLGLEANVALPLIVPGGESQRRALGILAFTFGEPRAFGPEEDAFMRAVADQCAQALERARLLAAEQEARREAEAASRAKGEFLATMSHELRTPLNAIGGHVQLLEMGLHGPVTTAQLEALGRVQRAQHHLLGLINDVLNYAKLEAGKVEYEVAEMDVVEVLQATIPFIEPQRLAKGLLWRLDVPAAPALVRGDREKLGQVLLNLFSNAVKFTPEGGRIDLRVVPARDGQELTRVEVRDTGIGIPPDRLELIFQPFVQVNASRARVHEGTGLGLTISRDLARGMGGDLTVESVLGVGSTFTLLLPAA